MPLNISEQGGGGFEPELGLHRAICTAIIDIGTQHSTYDGNEKVKRESIWQFELVDEVVDGDEGPFHPMMSQFYTLSLSPRANIRKALVNWRGKQFTTEELKAFDVFKVLGLPCNLMVGLKDNGKKYIETIAGWKGEKPEATRELWSFSFEEFDGTYPEWMTSGIKGLCEKSDEHQNFDGAFIDTAPAESVVDTDDIPF